MNDNDFISRKAALNAELRTKVDIPFYKMRTIKAAEGAVESAVAAYVEHIKAIPAADVRPVVLCRDCRWWTKQEKSLQGRCELAGFYPTGEWFCANGVRSNCGADMREPNLDTTKGEDHD